MDDLQTLLQGFEIYLQAAARRPTTITWYNKHILKFLAWLQHEAIPSKADRITAMHIRQYIIYLQGDVKAWDSNPCVPTQQRGLSSSYIAGSVTALRAWFNWMVDEELIAKNPMMRVPTPKEKQRLIEPLESREIKQLLRAIGRGTPTAQRNQSIVLTLLDCGLRVSELCQLELEDVSLQLGWIAIREGKGWKKRKVPMGGALRKSLWQYSAVRSDPMAGTRCFFLTSQGWPITADRVRKMLAYHGDRAGIANVHPHRFRHTFALHFLRHGGDSLTLKMLLGHSSLQMVNHYVHLASADLRAAHAKASPADHLRL